MYLRFDSRSRGIATQQLMSLLNVVTVINEHPDGAIQRGQFGKTSQPGRARERWKVSVELDRLSMTVHAGPAMIHAIGGERCLVDGDASEGMTQVGSKIGERARSAGEEDDSALPIDPPRNQPERETQRRPNR